jgi:hypothetical protein
MKSLDYSEHIYCFSYFQILLDGIDFFSRFETITFLKPL